MVGACTVRAFMIICDDQLGGFDGCNLQEQYDAKEDSLASPSLTSLVFANFYSSNLLPQVSPTYIRPCVKVFRLQLGFFHKA